jgi:uncharacterized protein YkwD
LRPKRTVRAAVAAPFESLGTLLSSHRGTSRVVVAALLFAFIIAVSAQSPVTIQAGPISIPLGRDSLLPQTLGVGVPTNQPVTVPFDVAMNPGAVEAALQVLPQQPLELAWNEELDQLTIVPERLWRTEETYVVIVGGSATRTDGRALAAARRFTFTTEIAPAVSDFQVRLANGAPAAAPQPSDERARALLEGDPIVEPPGSLPPTKTATAVSSSSTITVSFSEAMDRADVEAHFAITPAAAGELSWSDGGDLVFTPTERLVPGARYTISVIGAHDAKGNLLGGKGNFSFIVRPGAQLTQTLPEVDAADVEPPWVELWFSQPMDVEATNAAFALLDSVTGERVGGHLNWNAERTQLVYAPDRPFAGGRRFDVTFEGGARDDDGNVVEAAMSFTTMAAPVAPARGSVSTRTAPVVPVAAPATTLDGYALNQVNAARAAYGFAPLVLDAAISAAASAHAWDQATNGYFSHYGQNGSTRESRMRAAGVSFTYSGENQCYHMYMSEPATLDWCHAQFMAEPYPGQWNHIANILDPRFTRMGVGIATVGATTVITWDFAD